MKAVTLLGAKHGCVDPPIPRNEWTSAPRLQDRVLQMLAAGHGLRNILMYLLVIQSGLLFWDFSHPSVFMQADRAASRFEAMEMVLQSVHDGRWQTVLSNQGLPGDYVPHAFLFAVGGAPAIIVTQLALLFASVWALYLLVRLLTGSRVTAAMATLIYIHLPHTLVFPHMLSAEALYDPLVVLAFYLLAKVGQNALRDGRGAGLLFGAATLIRPVTLLWPVVVAALMLIRRRPILASMRFLFWSWLLIALWMFYIWMATGQFSMGSSSHDMGHNLYQRVERMIAVLPDAQRSAATSRFLVTSQGQEKVLSPADYFSFGWLYPHSFAAHLGRDALVFVGKSGIEKLTIDYFGLESSLRNELQNPGAGWRYQLEAAGVLATMKDLLTRAPSLVITSFLGAGGMLALWCFYAVGAYQIVRMKRTGRDLDARSMLLLLTLFPLYVFAISQAVDAMQSRHRAPVEFALCAIAAVGLESLLAKGRRNGATKAVLS